MNPADREGVTVRTKWLKFGVAVAVLYAVFTAIVALLLRIDPQLGLVVAVAVSIVSGVALTVFVLYVYR